MLISRPIIALNDIIIAPEKVPFVRSFYKGSKEKKAAAAALPFRSVPRARKKGEKREELSDVPDRRSSGL